LHSCEISFDQSFMNIRVENSDPGAGISWRTSLVAILMFLCSAAFIGVTGWELLVNGPFSWHISQPESVQGGIEALLLIASLATAQCLSIRRNRLIATLLISELFLRRHAVDFAVAFDLIYLEVLIALGSLAMRLNNSGKPERIPEYLHCFVLGLLIWGTFAWAQSALGYGTVRELRLLTCVLGAGAFFVRPMPLSMFAYQCVSKMSLHQRMLVGVLLGWLFVLFAKTNVSFFYDSLWYGLRGEHVLVGDKSAFASLGLVSVVYYYPKFYELLLIPVSGLGNAGIISGMTLMLFVLLAFSAYELLKQLGLTNPTVRLSVVIACLTLPVISNLSLDPKPDILAGLMLMLAWLSAIEFLKRPHRAPLFWMATCLILATQAKLTAIPYAAALVVATVIAGWSRRNDPYRDSVPSIAATRLAQIGLGLSLIVAGFVTARTLVLTGLPTIAPDPLFHLWQSMGFTLKPPANSMSWFSHSWDWRDNPQLAIDLLFRPQVLLHVVIYWTGNIWLWLVLVAVSAKLLVRRSALIGDTSDTKLFARTGAALICTGLILMFCVTYGTRGSDGNYYIAAIIPGVLVSASPAWRSISFSPLLRIVFYVCIALFAFFQAWYGFLSAGWAPGTRAFDLNFGRGIHEYRKANRRMLAAQGLGAIDYYLRHLDHSARVVSCLDHELDTRLPARTESAGQAFALGASANAMLNYLSDYKIEYVVMPRVDASSTKEACKAVPSLDSAISKLAADDTVKTIIDAKYVMYDLTHWQHKGQD
jgi:hypothetical protein